MVVHLVQGRSAAESLRASLGLRGVFGFDAAFSVGPVASGPRERLSHWLRRRASFWEEVFGTARSSPAYCARGLREALSSSEVTLWLGSGVEDQLFAAWFTSRLEDQSGASPVRAVQFTTASTRRGRMPASAIDLLPVDQVVAHPAVADVSPARLAMWRELWEAWTGPDPTALARLASSATPDPVVTPVIRTLLERFPDEVSGLPRWDLQLLRNIAAHGPGLTLAIGYTLAQAFEATDLIGDGWLFWRARRMAASALRHPLLVFEGSSSQLRGASVALTPAGREVVADDANAMALNGVDDWIGGAHLDSAHGRVWLRTPSGQLFETRSAERRAG